MRTAVQQTSIAAYHHQEAIGSAQCQRDEILGFIKIRGGDWSIGEVATFLGLQKSSVSARVNELLAARHVVEAPKRLDGFSGRLVRPVRLPQSQLDLF